MTEDERQARTRYFILTGFRVMAMAMIAMGLIIAFGERGIVAEPLALPVGLGLLILGLIELLVIIPMLTRRWRSPQ